MKPEPLLFHIDQVSFLMVFDSYTVLLFQVRGLSPFAVELGFHVEEYAASKGSFPPKKRRTNKSLYIATIEKVTLAMLRLSCKISLQAFSCTVWVGKASKFFSGHFLRVISFYLSLNRFTPILSKDSPFSESFKILIYACLFERFHRGTFELLLLLCTFVRFLQGVPEKLLNV